MQLIERYIQAVKFWLPQAQQEDIAAELQANILATAEDKEAELGRQLHEEEEVVILKQIGPPPLVAARYRADQGTVAFGPQLIGPLAYPFYRLAVKATLAILAAYQFLNLVTLVLAGRRNVMQAVIQAFWQLIDIAVMPLLLVTGLFALIDYALRKNHLAERWDPRTLPPLERSTQVVPRATSIAGIVAQLVAIVWWLNLPNFPDVFFGQLRPAPIWQTLYVPVLLVAFATLVQNIVTLLRPRWTWVPPAVGLVTSLMSLVIIYPLLQTSPLVSFNRTEPTELTALKVGKLNTTIYLAVLGTWIGILIYAIVEAVKCTRLGRDLFIRTGPVSTKTASG